MTNAVKRGISLAISVLTGIGKFSLLWLCSTLKLILICTLHLSSPSLLPDIIQHSVETKNSYTMGLGYESKKKLLIFQRDLTIQENFNKL